MLGPADSRVISAAYCASPRCGPLMMSAIARAARRDAFSHWFSMRIEAFYSHYYDGGFYQSSVEAE